MSNTTPNPLDPFDQVQKKLDDIDKRIRELNAGKSKIKSPYFEQFNALKAEWDKAFAELEAMNAERSTVARWEAKAQAAREAFERNMILIGIRAEIRRLGEEAAVLQVTLQDEVQELTGDLEKGLSDFRNPQLKALATENYHKLYAKMQDVAELIRHQPGTM